MVAMDRSWVYSLLLLILFISNASSRELVDEEAQTNNSDPATGKNSPFPSQRPIGDGKSVVKPAESPLPNTNLTSPNPNEVVSPPPQMQPGNEKNVTKVLNATEPKSSPPTVKQADKPDNGELSSKMAPLTSHGSQPPPISLESGKTGEESATLETCTGQPKICRTENALVACTLSIETGSGKWLILVQNEGEKSLKANIVLPDSVNNSFKELTLAKHQSQRVNITISGETDKIILNAGQGDCVLHRYPSKQSSLSIHLPSYEKLVTPINGAYFLILSVVIFGGAWACCICCNNHRAGNGVPYHELEMGIGSAVESKPGVDDVETVDWDEGWDDDWDENNAVKSPGGANNVSISANGLTARAPNRNGWDHDWDD